MTATRRLDSENTCEVWAAFVAAQADLAAVPKSSKADTGKFTYGYAPLPDVLAAAKAALGAHGLAVAQDVTVDGVTTIIAHTSGQTLRFGPLPIQLGAGPQQTGSAITYMRRYGLMAALGIAAEDDDAQSWTPPAAKPPPAISQAQVDQIAALFDQIEDAERRRTAKVDWAQSTPWNLREIPPSKFDECYASAMDAVEAAAS